MARSPELPRSAPRQRAMSAALLLALILGVVFGSGSARPLAAYAEAPRRVVLLRVGGVIDSVTAQYVQRGIRYAQSTGASLVLIELDTPGGLDSAMRQIIQSIFAAGVPVAVYVAPSGARAASAGVFITMAAQVAAMAPGTNIGAAHPVNIAGGEIAVTENTKITNDAVAYLRAIALQRGRNADWGEQAIRESASLPADQAVAEHVVDFLAGSDQDLLAKANGRSVEVAGATVKLDLSGAVIQPMPMSLVESIVHTVADPNLAFVLLVLGVVALVAEFFHPGAVLPGVTGVICLVLAFIALGSLPVNWGGVVLIAVAFGLFIADTHVSSLALTAAGMVCFVVGALLLFSPFTPLPPAMPRLAVSPWLLGLMTILLVAFFSFALAASLRAQRAAATTGTQTLVGERGVAITDLNPAGIVRVRSETWSATSDGRPVRVGTAVEVVSVAGLRLSVRPVDEPQPPSET